MNLENAEVTVRLRPKGVREIQKADASFDAWHQAPFAAACTRTLEPTKSVALFLVVSRT